jgi:uncharacterized protein (DUF433 family)
MRVMAAPSAIGHYTAGEVGRLAGVSGQTIGQWARYSIIPSVSTNPRVYSYADAGEAVLVRYLLHHELQPSDVREIVKNLRDKFGAWPLTNAPLAHDGRFVVVRDREGRVFSASYADQGVLEGTLERLTEVDLFAIRTALSRGGWVADLSKIAHVEVDPERLSGQPTIRGKRIATEVVADLARDEAGREVLREDFHLTEEEIADAVEYERAVREAVAA